MDMVITPICATLRAFGCFRAADFIFRLGPHELATKLGACGYYDPAAEEARHRAQMKYGKDQEQEEREALEDSLRAEFPKLSTIDAIQRALKEAGYTIHTNRKKGTNVRYPWVWLKPKRRQPTERELALIELSEHLLVDRLDKEQYDFDD
jgi:hypothetical protein